MDVIRLNVQWERLEWFESDAIFRSGTRSVKDGSEGTTENTSNGRFFGLGRSDDVCLLLLAYFEPAGGRGDVSGRRNGSVDGVGVTM